MKLALKKLDKKDLHNLPYFYKEVEIHGKLKHANIIQLISSFEDDSYIYLLMEPALKGDVFDYSRKEVIPESLKKRIFK